MAVFTGVRINENIYNYNGINYPLVGVNDDVIQCEFGYTPEVEYRNTRFGKTAFIGGYLYDKNKCVYCGRGNDRNDEVCESCGAPLE